ncbi:hypothetical protein CRU86_05745 [Aliarcobacter skirrowii]|uniref:helix-turn-helix domain-containing protein n=1 Tax=Aliarcobacter skirrowii TaxID=28200 RepID=UPI00100B5DDE|nr:helix-turn-helix domain-containing protein [Aliarcobacter skirrowii]RXJ77406.1 hypothetical protein CRU86_05745 [Aliarcobacter skirrowii]
MSIKNQKEKRGFRPKEGAEYLGVSLSQFWNLVKVGEIKTIKLSDKVTISTKEVLDNFLDSKMGA